MNASILTIVEDEVAPVVMERLHEVDADNDMLGLRAFLWNIEQTI